MPRKHTTYKCVEICFCSILRRAASLRVTTISGKILSYWCTGEKAFKEKITRGMGGFYFIPPELHRTAVLTAKWNRKSHIYEFKITMVEQFEMKLRKEEIIIEKKL